MTRPSFLSAAAGAALSLVAYGVRSGKKAPAGTSPTEDSNSAACATGDAPGGDALGNTDVGSTAGGTTDESASVDKSDEGTKVRDLIDKYQNPTLYALMNLNGIQLQQALGVLGFGWNEDVRMYMAQNRAFAVQRIDKDANTACTSKDEIAALGAGASGSSVFYMMNLQGYTDPSEAMRSIANVSMGDSEVASGTVPACVYGENMQRHIAKVYEVDRDSLMLRVTTEDAIMTGAFTKSGGAPFISDYWEDVTGRKLGNGY